MAFLEALIMVYNKKGDANSRILLSQSFLPWSGVY